MDTGDRPTGPVRNETADTEGFSYSSSAVIEDTMPNADAPALK
jgi:hypothetical protein